jgi:hypothetical protein
MLYARNPRRRNVLDGNAPMTAREIADALIAGKVPQATRKQTLSTATDSASMVANQSGYQ